MHVLCSPFAGNYFLILNEIKYRNPSAIQNRHFISQIVTLKFFRPCHCSADSGNTAASPLPPPPNLKGKAPRKFWNAASLAFLGDSVWEVRYIALLSCRAVLFYKMSYRHLNHSHKTFLLHFRAAIYKTQEFLPSKQSIRLLCYCSKPSTS
jgi:hypothetical protein